MSEADKFWDEVVHPLRKKLGLALMSDAEAEKAYDEAPEIPLSPDRIEEMVRYATDRIREEKEDADG